MKHNHKHSKPHPKRRRRRPHKLQRKVKKQTATIVHRLQHDLTSPGESSTKGSVHSVTQLRASLHTVRQDVQRDGAGRHTTLVVGALGDLDHFLQTLAHGLTVTDPNTKLQLLAHAKRSLDQAQHKATRAGDDWPL